MSTLLVVKANPKPLEHSSSLQVAKEFVDKFKENNPDVEIIEFDLFESDYPGFDYNVMSAFSKLMRGSSFDDLTPDEQSIMQKREAILKQFMDSDYYVFVNPMWEFSFPGRFKEYLDTVVAAGKTFKYDETGTPIGLLKGQNKKALYIQATGGFYDKMPDMQFGINHTRAAMKFIGIDNFDVIDVQGQSIPNVSDEQIEIAFEKARKFAKEF